MAFKGSVKEVTAIELYSRLICDYFQKTSCYRIIYRGIHFQLNIYNKIMIITTSELKLIIIFIYSFSDGTRCCEIKRSSRNGSELTCGYKCGIDRGDIFCIYCKYMIKDITIASPVKIKICMISYIQ